MSLMRLLCLLTVLPGRLLIRWIDQRRRGNGLRPMGRFLRSSVHGFLVVCAMMVLSMAIYTPAPVVAPSQPVPTSRVPVDVGTRGGPGPAGLPGPTATTAPTSTTAPASEPRIYIDRDDDDDDWDKPRFCHRKWYC